MSQINLWRAKSKPRKSFDSKVGKKWFRSPGKQTAWCCSLIWLSLRLVSFDTCSFLPPRRRWDKYASHNCSCQIPSLWTACCHSIWREENRILPVSDPSQKFANLYRDKPPHHIFWGIRRSRHAHLGPWSRPFPLMSMTALAQIFEEVSSSSMLNSELIRRIRQQEQHVKA